MPVSMAVNQNIVELEYAVRGPIPQRAAELARAGRRTIPCNIGNPQALGQSPITFYRQVLSFLEAPTALARERRFRGAFDANSSAFLGVDESDFVDPWVIEYCEKMLGHLGSGIGAYTDSNGPAFIREAVAGFIDRRDGADSGSGVPADPDSIFLTNGASEAVRFIIDLLISDAADGIMIPIPQYPLYSATIKKAGGAQVEYHPDEEKGWTLDRAILDDAICRARDRSITVKAIVIINPANPTGAILPAEGALEVVDFAEENRLAIIADEVYQDNLYGAEFVSFAKLVGKRDIPLFSLHSTSKGFHGECGRRGGYVEIRNPIDIEGADVRLRDLFFKQASVALCSNTTGQALTYIMVTPPPEGSPPHGRYQREKETILSALQDKATMIREAFEEMREVECFGRTGAMYLFPRLGRLPGGKTDFDYCMALLEETGLCTVNGSGFGQRPGTHHLRIAFLPPKEMLDQVLPDWIAFHNAYVQ
ncbi:MAG: aminotransferase class I/II [Gemmatimonadetes bacterium]|nr:aminotransferase class I/II [Gemmatimonadota bacterium]